MKLISFFAIIFFLLNTTFFFSQTKDSLQITNKLFKSQFIEFKKDKLDSFNIDILQINYVLDKLQSKVSIDILTKVTQRKKYKKYILNYLTAHPQEKYTFGTYIAGLLNENKSPILVELLDDYVKMNTFLMPNTRNFNSPIKAISIYFKTSNPFEYFYYLGSLLKNQKESNFLLDKKFRFFQYKKDYVQFGIWNNFKRITVPIILNKKNIGFMVLYFG